MSSKATATTLVSISLASLALAAGILFVVFPWAETKPDPDAIQAPTWFLALFLLALAVIFAGTALAFAVRRGND